MSETLTQDNQVAVIENSIEVLKAGPQILVSNQQRKDKALSVGRNILDMIQENGMNPELDERSKNYLININTASKQMKEERLAVTQIMDQLKKMYTEVENELDPKKAGTIPAQVQSHRDAYAKQVAEEADRKRREAEKAAAEAKERIEVKSKLEIKLAEYFNTYLLDKKQKFNNKFNSLVLDSFADDAAAIRGYEPKYSVDHFNEFAPMLPSSLSQDMIHELAAEVKDGKYENYADTYKSEMLALKQEIVDKLPSKYAELQEQRRLEIEKRDAERAAAAAKNEADRKAAEERQRLAQEAEKKAAEERKRREDEENARIAEEAAVAQKKAEEDALIKKQGEETMVMFEKEAAIAETAPAPEVRQGFEITVLHPVGFTQIFAIWFEKVGKDLPVDKIGGTKLEQMKAWAEKEAHKNGTKIDSKFLKYDETFKAVNRKSK